MKLGTWILALSSIAAGLFDLIWREFEPAHQPIHALADVIPGEPFLAAIAAALLILGGAAILLPRTARYGAIALAIIYTVFALFWIPRFVTAPKYLGWHFTVFNGVVDGIATQLIVAAAALILYTLNRPSHPLYTLNRPSHPRAVQIARWVFGLSAVDFGLAHLTGVAFVATMMPSWFPLGGPFWVVVSGIAFVLAGVAILARVRDVLAARLLALMFVCFSAFLLIPNIFAASRDHLSWGSNAYNLAAAGSTLIFAAAISIRASDHG
ncbi:MAG TPA: hypothetical protein VGL89_00590 [Candidatus Koribacter sp.]